MDDEEHTGVPADEWPSPTWWPGDEIIPMSLRVRDPEDIPPTRSVDRFRRTTAGMMLGAATLAVRDLLEAPRETAPIEIEAPGAPPGSRGIDIELDPDDPAASVVTVRQDDPTD